MSQPRATVVICAFNRERQIEACLESLAATRYEPFEIVVVDDGSTDGTLGRCREFRRRHPGLALKIVRSARNLGVSGARNLGVAEAAGDLVAFTDSDCTVDPGWLGALAAALERSQAAGASGPVVDDPPRNLAELAFSGSARIGASASQGRPLVGGNMCLPRQLLVEHPFDAALRYGCDEDDLAWRLGRQGHRFAFAPEAVVRHHHPLDLRGYLGLGYRQGRGSAHYWRKRRIFLGRDLALLVAAAAALPLTLAGGRWWLAPAVLLVLHLSALLYAELRFKGKPLAAALRALPLLGLYSVAKLMGVASYWLRPGRRDATA